MYSGKKLTHNKQKFLGRNSAKKKFVIATLKSTKSLPLISYIESVMFYYCHLDLLTFYSFFSHITCKDFDKSLHIKNYLCTLRHHW